ncbi:MAG: hypothetical protein RL235_267 [Chlamydiota bacterium]|jgi:hypothetical protein
MSATTRTQLPIINDSGRIEIGGHNYAARIPTGWFQRVCYELLSWFWTPLTYLEGTREITAYVNINSVLKRAKDIYHSRLDVQRACKNGTLGIAPQKSTTTRLERCQALTRVICREKTKTETIRPIDQNKIRDIEHLSETGFVSLTTGTPIDVSKERVYRLGCALIRHLEPDKDGIRKKVIASKDDLAIKESILMFALGIDPAIKRAYLRRIQSCQSLSKHERISHEKAIRKIEQDRDIPEPIVRLLRQMTDPQPEQRPTMEDVQQIWNACFSTQIPRTTGD